MEYNEVRRLNEYGIDYAMGYGGYGGYGGFPGWGFPIGLPLIGGIGLGINPNLFLYKSFGYL